MRGIGIGIGVRIGIGIGIGVGVGIGIGIPHIPLSPYPPIPLFPYFPFPLSPSEGDASIEIMSRHGVISRHGVMYRGSDRLEVCYFFFVLLSPIPLSPYPPAKEKDVAKKVLLNCGTAGA